jgi:hypothetical protein
MNTLHPLAPHHLPPFVTAPGHTDVLFVAMAIFVLLAVVCIGVFYFKLHALPEHMAHRGQKIQFEIVAVLALIALFTHNHAFWIAALLLALVPLPDFTTPLTSMARSLNRMARPVSVPRQAEANGGKAPDETVPPATPSTAAGDAAPGVAKAVEIEGG